MKRTKRNKNKGNAQELKESMINRLLKKKFESSDLVASLIIDCGDCGCGEVVANRLK